MSATRVTNDAELARLLGVDRALVSRDKRRGMPTDTLEAAQAWRSINLRVRMRTDSKIQRQHRARQADDAAVGNVAQLMDLGQAALQAGRFRLVESELRAAMRAVPAHARDRVQVVAEVMEALCEPVLSAVRECQAEIDSEQHQPPAGGPSPAAAEGGGWGAGMMARFWYSIAAGEAVDAETLEPAQA